ncbi:MAG: hypothetical protein F6K35_50570 [Okeania sp. SIO2H7]|nr:hypothetical protein [Okeania sp. SIO2H7]
MRCTLQIKQGQFQHGEFIDNLQEQFGIGLGSKAIACYYLELLTVENAFF